MTTQGEPSTAVRQVPIRLTTSQDGLEIPNVPYLIPAGWKRTQLSTLVNRLLTEDGRSTRAIPFEFLIDGQLLRTSLEQYLDTKGLTEETTLEIQYIQSTLPPTFTAAFPHQDWISSVDASQEQTFLTASYDGNVRLFGTSVQDKPLATLNLGAPLHHACWLPGKRMASAAMDGRLRIATFSETTAQLESSSVASTFTEAMPLSHVCVNAKGNTLATTSWDGSIAIWDAAASSSTSNGQSTKSAVKRRKTSKPTVAVANLVPLSVFWHVAPTNDGVNRLPGTNARVAGSAWLDESRLASAGWDGAIRMWDVAQTNAAIAAKTSEKVVSCIAAMHATKTATESIVTGHMDRSIALWDFRLPATQISIAFNAAHSSSLASIASHPINQYLFATGAYDGTMKVWDIRSPKAALFALVKPGSGGGGGAGKVLALDWDSSGQVIVAGGEDCQLSIFRGSAIGVHDGKKAT